MTVRASDTGGSGSTPLVLRLVRSRGLQRVGAFNIAPEGSGVATALQIGGVPLSEAGIEDADRCVIARLDGQWILCNESRGLVCALNGQRIGLGKRPALFDGDVLELGLLRFEIDAAPSGGHGVAEAEPPPWVQLAGYDPLGRGAAAASTGFLPLAQPPDSTW
ncbi:hypothetical protein [Variovorax sp. ZT4R33]|uniref:hypothetical protein n=1 Tax=Variovorax sp. ZT4R33 TaxID=3443743 RepID=UPI003F480630